MTPERAKELLPVIQAFAEGKTIERRFTGSDGCDGYHYWKTDLCPDWNSYDVYRVKETTTMGKLFYEAQLANPDTSKWETFIQFQKDMHEVNAQRFLKLYNEQEAQS